MPFGFDLCRRRRAPVPNADEQRVLGLIGEPSCRRPIAAGYRGRTEPSGSTDEGKDDLIHTSLAGIVEGPRERTSTCLPMW